VRRTGVGLDGHHVARVDGDTALEDLAGIRGYRSASPVVAGVVGMLFGAQVQVVRVALCVRHGE